MPDTHKVEIVAWDEGSAMFHGYIYVDTDFQLLVVVEKLKLKMDEISLLYPKAEVLKSMEDWTPTA
jgi:hypothetical protein